MKLEPAARDQVAKVEEAFHRWSESPRERDALIP